jgi:hypothetical protein
MYTQLGPTGSTGPTGPAFEPSGTLYGDYLYWINITSLWTVGSTDINLGGHAGEFSQGTNAIAIGYFAGQNTQGQNAIAIGNATGSYNQFIRAIAIGDQAGYTGQGTQSIAIGYRAGYTGQQSGAIAIGQFAGQTNQSANTIIINATGSGVTGTTASATYIAPIRGPVTSSFPLYYNTSTNEVTYNSFSISRSSAAPGWSGASNVTAISVSLGIGTYLLTAYGYLDYSIGATGTLQARFYNSTDAASITTYDFYSTIYVGGTKCGFSLSDTVTLAGTKTITVELQTTAGGSYGGYTNFNAIRIN